MKASVRYRSVQLYKVNKKIYGNQSRLKQTQLSSHRYTHAPSRSYEAWVVDWSRSKHFKRTLKGVWEDKITKDLWSKTGRACVALVGINDAYHANFLLKRALRLVSWMLSCPSLLLPCSRTYVSTACQASSHLQESNGTATTHPLPKTNTSTNTAPSPQGNPAPELLRWL